MLISSLYIKSILHLNHNEDEQFVFNDNKKFFIGAIFDGCSSAEDSYWAAGLIKKLISKQVKAINTSTTAQGNSPTPIGNRIIKGMFDDLKYCKSYLNLKTEELLSTIIITVIDKSNGDFWAAVNGDGIIKLDDEVIVVDQQNAPDFLGYHLDENQNDPLIYFKEFNGVVNKQLIISTDGLLKFNNPENKESEDWLIEKGVFNLVKYELIEESLLDSYNYLRKRKGFLPQDDLSILAIQL